MRDFVESHKCNAVCRHLGLPDPNASVAAPEPRQVGVAYALSAYVPPPVQIPANYGRRTGSEFAMMAMMERLPPVVYEEEEDEEDEESEEEERENQYVYECEYVL